MLKMSGIGVGSQRRAALSIKSHFLTLTNKNAKQCQNLSQKISLKLKKDFILYVENFYNIEGERSQVPFTSSTTITTKSTTNLCKLEAKLFLAKSNFWNVFPNSRFEAASTYSLTTFPWFLPKKTHTKMTLITLLEQIDGCDVPSLNKNFLLRCKTLCSTTTTATVLTPLTIQVHSDLKRHYHICT